MLRKPLFSGKTGELALTLLMVGVLIALAVRGSIPGAVAIVALLVARFWVSSHYRERELRARARLAKREQRELSRKLEAALNQIGAGWVEHSIEGRILRVNERFATMVGESPESLIGREWKALRAAEEAERSEKQEETTCERALRSASGESLWVSESVTLLRNDAGEPLYFVSLLTDIGDRRRTEQAVRASLDLLNAILRGATDGIVAHEGGESCVYANDAAARLLGFDRADHLLHANAAKIRERIELMDKWERPVELGELPGFSGLPRGEGPELLLCARSRATGSERWLKWKTVPLRDAKGHVTLALTFLRDVSEARRSELERALLLDREKAARADAEASQRHYKLLTEMMPHIVWSVRSDGSLEYFNQRWYEYSGLRADSVDWGQWQRVGHPEDTYEALYKWREASARGAPFEFEIRFKRASDGAYRWHLVRAAPVKDATGVVTRWLGSATDVEDQKQAEHSLRFMAAAGEALISSLDENETLRRFAELSVPRLGDFCLVEKLSAGTEPQVVAVNGLNGSSPSEVIAPLLAPQEDEPGLRVLTEAELRAWANTLPSHVAVRSAARLSVRVRGEVAARITLGSASAAHGATELALAEALALKGSLALENARLYREAQLAVQLRDDFVATVSHELRTPLNAILGWAQLLRTGRLDDRRRERALDTIERNAKSQAQLIEDILDMSRIITGRLRVDLRPVEIASVVEASLETLRPTAENKGVKLELVQSARPMLVQADADRMQQVIWNIVNNAIKFSPAGGSVLVTVDDEGGRARIQVQDNGQGIAPNFLPLVFERFRQADSSSTRRYGGLGLGLAIVRHLMELHGGSVEAHSEGLGRGSTFTLKLPLSFEHPLADARSQGDVPDALALAGVRILLVDDLSDAREVLSTLLSTHGASVRAVGSSAEALAAFVQETPDILVSDIGMPDEDGHMLLRRIRALPPENGGHVPAVAVSAYAGVEDRSRAIASGYHAHVSKPVRPDVLINAVRKLAPRRESDQPPAYN